MFPPSTVDRLTEARRSAVSAGPAKDGLTIALLEDQDVDAEVVTRRLDQAWPAGVELERYERLADLEAALTTGQPDIVFCDLSVPDARGIGLLERAVAAAGPVPVVVLTSASDPGLSIAALERGAQDYLVKERYTVEELARTLRHSLARSRADDALRRAAAELQSANAELEECLEVMAHDLRGPLRTGRLFAERLVHATRSGNDGEPIAAALDASLSRMDTMVERLLLLATLREARPAPEPRPLSAVVEQVAAELGPALDTVGGRFHVDADGEVVIDPGLFGDLLWEMAQNSIKYRSTERPLEVRFAVRNDGDATIITVRDNGIGVAPEYQDRVFRLFERLNSDAEPGP
ncbi:MAG: response regulator, partial [Actinomycetota bacterium]